MGLDQGRKAAVGSSVFQFLFSALLDLDFIRHRDPAALFNSRFFGAAPLEPDLFHYREPAPKKNTLRLLVVESNTASRWRTPRAGRENQNNFQCWKIFKNISEFDIFIEFVCFSKKKLAYIVLVDHVKINLEPQTIF